MFYNVHVHIFNAKAIPENFLGKGLVRLLSRSTFSFLLVLYFKRASVFIVQQLERIPGIGAVVGQGLAVPSRLVAALDRHRITRWMAGVLRWFADVPLDFLERYAAFADAGRERSQELIFEKLKNLPCYNPDTRFVVLTLNMDHMGAGKARINFKTQLSLVERLKKKYPNQFFPFLSIDPRSNSAQGLLDLLKMSVEDLGFIGIKLYPALGFYPFDPKLKGIYQYAEANQIPVMTHCTKGGVYYKGRWMNEHLHPLGLDGLPVSGFDWIRTNDKRNKVFKNNFTDPANYIPVLEMFKDLKICFAHFGGSGQILEFLRRKEPPAALFSPGDMESVKAYFSSEPNWYARVRCLMASMKQVYTDVSYTLAEEGVLEQLYKDISDPLVRQKILFGTDYYMTEQEKYETRMVTEFREFLSRQAGNETAFHRIAVENPKQYLTSELFTAP